MKSEFYKVSVEDGHSNELECHYFRFSVNAIRFAVKLAERYGGLQKQLDGVGLCQAEVITKTGEIIWFWKEIFRD